MESEAFDEWLPLTPMKAAIVETEEQFTEVVDAMAKKGLRLACVSNAGLVGGQRRLTFLPNSAFTDSPKA